ncbi:MAG: alpha/beta hydrolase [Bermanella sp.]
MNEATKIKIFKRINRILLKPVFGPPWPFAVQRTWFKLVAATSLLPKGTRIEKVAMAKIPAEVIVNVAHGTQENSQQKVILYLHGGAYSICAPQTHRSLTASLANKTQAKVFVPDYKLAPEHPFPAGIEDCLSSYQWLLEQGYCADNIVIAGDSAGAGLAMATIQRIREIKISQPAAVILISPWSDLTLASEGKVNDAIDPLLRWSNLRAGVKAYLQGQDPKNPLASPAFANFSDLPPILVQVGTEEILLNDANKLQQQAQKYQAKLELSIYQGGWHVFQLQAGLLEISDRAIKEIDDFINEFIPQKSSKRGNYAK